VEIFNKAPDERRELILKVAAEVGAKYICETGKGVFLQIWHISITLRHLLLFGPLYVYA
jgi:hypothetical protein